MKPFNPEHYYRASLERMGQAHLPYREGNSYALCIYIAGLAVVCMLRAFKGKRGQTFDEKHNLKKLFTDARLLNSLDEGGGDLGEDAKTQIGREIQQDIATACLLWSNDIRFAGEERLRSHLRKAEELRRTAKGDILKAAVYRLVSDWSIEGSSYGQIRDKAERLAA